MSLLFTEEIKLDRVGIAAVGSVDGERGGFGGDDEHTAIEADGRRPAGPGEVQELAVGHWNFVVTDIDHAEDAGTDAVVGRVEVQADESVLFGGGRDVDRGRNDIDGVMIWGALVTLPQTSVAVHIRVMIRVLPQPLVTSSM